MSRTLMPKMNPTQPQPGEDLLDLDEAAKVVTMSSSWLYKRCSERCAPAIRIGGRIKFRRADLLAWMQLSSNNEGAH